MTSQGKPATYTAYSTKEGSYIEWCSILGRIFNYVRYGDEDRFYPVFRFDLEGKLVKGVISLLHQKVHFSPRYAEGLGLVFNPGTPLTLQASPIPVAEEMSFTPFPFKAVVDRNWVLPYPMIIGTQFIEKFGNIFLYLNIEDLDKRLVVRCDMDKRIGECYGGKRPINLNPM